MQTIIKLSIVFISTFIVSCGQKNEAPDVSKINATVQVERFEKDFFTMDTLDLDASLSRLQQTYGDFLNDYLFHILQSPPEKDSVLSTVKRFLKDYAAVYIASQKQIPSFNTYKKEIEYSLKLTRYYFPNYQLPESVITFVGPLEGYGNIITNRGLAVGLQLYLGADYPMYKEDFLREVYPQYISRRFEPPYISVNCIKNVVDDICPYQPSNQPLVEMMIEQGKRLYLLDRLMPDTPDSLKTGYTAQQLTAAYKNEGVIWSFFVQNDLLYVKDQLQIRDYINDAPNTAVFGPESPGNIGMFTGWQIVKKFMKEQKNVTLQAMLETPAQTIFQKAKYKPD